MINSAMGKTSTIPSRNFFNKLLGRSDKKQVVQNLVDVLKNINTDLDELVEAVIYIQIKEPFNWDSLIIQYNPNTVSTRYLNKDTRKDVETYLSKLALIYEKLQSYENNEFIDKLRYVILNYLINLLDIIIYGITQHLESFLSNRINIDTPTLFNLLLAALTYTDQRITYFTFYLTINSIVQKQINILKQSYQINNNLRTMDDFNLGIFRKLKHVFDNLLKSSTLTLEQKALLNEKFIPIKNKLNPIKSNGKITIDSSAADTVTDSLESPISDDPIDDAVAAAVDAVAAAEAEVPVESALDTSVSVTSETAPVASDESASDESVPESAPVRSAPDESVPDESVPESAPVRSAPDESAPVVTAPVVTAPDVSAPVVTAPVESESESQTTPLNEPLKQVQDAYNPVYEQLLSLNTNTIFSKDYDINPLYTSWANAFAAIKNIINFGHIPDKDKKYICLVKIKTTALYTILYAVKVNKYIQDKFTTIQSILLENTAKNTIDIRKQIVFILEKWNAIYGKLRLMINQMKMIDPANNKKANNTLKKLQSIYVSKLLQLTNELTTELSKYNTEFNPTWWNTAIHGNKYNTIKDFFTKALKHLTEINKNTSELVQDVKFYNKLIKNNTIEFPKKYEHISNIFYMSFAHGGKLRSRSPFRSRSSRKAK